jgi:AMMECR1 domain-containing protein
MRRQLGATALLLLCLWPQPSQATELDKYQAPAARKAIATITHDAIRAYIEHRPYSPHPTPALCDAAGVFVTLSHKGQTRACWGTVRPRLASLAAELAANAARALYKDYRQAPISRTELDGLVAHVSIVGDLQPVGSPAELQPRRYGLLVAGQGRGGVLLPGEAATAAWQVYTCRRKAGLRAGERASMYRFETVVIGPIALSAKE